MTKCKAVVMVTAVFCLIATLLFAFDTDEKIDKHHENDEKEFVCLFNGKDLSGWHVIGNKCWKVEDGVIVCAGEGSGWLRSDKQFQDFVLRLEYQISKGGNSGIFIRASAEGNPAFTGMEVQILDDKGGLPTPHTTGAIYDVVAPKKNMSKPHGEWNFVEIICSGDWVVVAINGEEIIRVNMDENEKLKKRLRKGYIGVQNHGDKVKFRNIRIKELKGDEKKQGDGHDSG